jgi:hypothetical protein
MRAIERVVAGGGEISPMRQALLSLAVSTALSLLTACENRPAEDTPHQMANADQQSSAEGLAIVGLYALKKLRECNDHPDAPCAFRNEAQGSGNQQKN